jgi:hypothetical protein
LNIFCGLVSELHFWRPFVLVVPVGSTKSSSTKPIAPMFVRMGRFPQMGLVCLKAQAITSARSPTTINMHVACAHAPLNARLHRFQRGYAAEFKESWNGSEIALKIDDRPWMAWSRHILVLTTEESFVVGVNSSLLLLPQRVNTSVQVNSGFYGRVA